jgi:hypothetical protein
VGLVDSMATDPFLLAPRESVAGVAVSDDAAALCLGRTTQVEPVFGGFSIQLSRQFSGQF